MKLKKEALVLELQALDAKADVAALSSAEWGRRYTLDDEMFILSVRGAILAIAWEVVVAC